MREPGGVAPLPDVGPIRRARLRSHVPRGSAGGVTTPPIERSTRQGLRVAVSVARHSHCVDHQRKMRSSASPAETSGASAATELIVRSAMFVQSTVATPFR